MKSRIRNGRRRAVMALIVALLMPLALPGAARAQAEQPPATTDAPAVDEAPPADPSAATPGMRDSVVRLYHAVFDRAPDPAGQAYWVGQYVDEHVPLDRIAELFVNSEEWRTTYGEVDDIAFVELLYGNVLGRTPDAQGRHYWASELGAGVTRTSILLGFSESAEFVAATGTATPEAPPPPPPVWPALPPGSGSGRRIVYSNSRQLVWLVEADETIVDAYAVSGRVATPTPGTYSVYSKSPRAWAGHDGITMQWMVRFAWGRSLAIGFHSIPRYANGVPMQSEAQLGTHRSSGCVRQADHKARALYDWAPVGTTVVVTP